MQKKSCIAMLLAGGQGSRLGALTRKLAKPAVSFGGKYRIIDFALSNCAQSGIDTVGVLTQYRPVLLNAYLGTGRAWDLDEASGGVFALPPYQAEWGGVWYKGTANAIYQHMDFISRYDPETVLIISGDHIYRMDYAKMLAYHRKMGAAVTISTIAVPWEEASRFGILTSDETGRIIAFDEKPKEPRSNLASMGIYIFDWDVLSKSLAEDEADPASDNDFGKNIIPKLLAAGAPLYAYNFEGYWRDVGTLESYYNANMEFLSDDPPFDLYTSENRVYSSNNIHAPTYLGPQALVQRSIVTNGCAILGTVRRSVLSREVTVGEGAIVEDSILLPGAQIGANCRLSRAVVGEEAVLEPGAVLGAQTEGEEPQWGISVVADKARIPGESVLPRGSNVLVEND